VLIRAYLDAETSDHTLPDLKATLETFARRKGHRVSAFYNDYEEPKARSSLFRLLRDKGVAIGSQARSGQEPPPDPMDELFRLLQDSRPNDVFLIETASQLRTVSDGEWQRLRQKIKQKKVRIVSLDVEASWVMVTSESAMAPTAEKLTAMMLDVLEATPARAVEKKRGRHLEGIARAKARGKYKGRPVNRKKHEQILTLLDEGYSWTEVCAKTGASRSTVARVVKVGDKKETRPD